MSSLNRGQREEKRGTQLHVHLACWTLVVGCVLGLGQRGFAQEFTLTSLGFDESIREVSPLVADSQAEPLPALVPALKSDLPELTLADQSNIGSTGLLNLCSASVRNLDIEELKFDNASLPIVATVPADNRLEIRFDLAELSKPANPAPAKLRWETDEFAGWIVKPASMSTFASSMVEPAWAGSSLSLPVTVGSIGVGDPTLMVVPMDMDLMDDRRIASLAGQ